MGRVGQILSIDEPDDGICNSMWGRNKCPNQAAFILKNRDNKGFAVMCKLSGSIRNLPCFQRFTRNGKFRLKAPKLNRFSW